MQRTDMWFGLRGLAVGWIVLVAVGMSAADERTDGQSAKGRERALEAARHELEALRHAVDEQKRDATARIEALERGLDEARETERNLRLRIERLERSRDAARARAQAAEAELGAMRRAVESQHRTAENEIDTLQDRLATATTSAEKLRGRLGRLRDRNNSLDAEVASLREETERAHELEKRLQQQEFRIRELEHSREVDRERVRELRIERARVEEMMSEVRRRRAESLEALTAIVARRAAALPAVARAPSGAVETKPGLVEVRLPAGGAPGPPRREIDELERRLDVERERRRTLEGEVQRLHAAVGKAEGYRQAWEQLQDARAEILVLTNRLAEEKEQRREIEVLLQEVQAETDGDGSPAGAVRELVALSRERRKEARRLESELREATEAIVRLKGRLEAIGSPEEDALVLGDLEEENSRLREDLADARGSIERLREQASLAERLADLVYSDR